MTTTTNNNRPRGRGRRGVAMMLVVVALAVGTVIAAAALTSNDNSSTIGQNTIDSSKAKWSARAASDIVVAAMQTETNWASIMSGDKLIENWDVGGTVVDVRVTDLEGNPATFDDREVLITIETDGGSITEKVETQVSRAVETVFGTEIDTSLGEFGIYTTDELMTDATSSVCVWGKSPEAKLRPEVKIGTDASSSGGLKINSSTRLKGCHIYVNDSASSSLRSAVNASIFAGGRVVPDVIPVLPILLDDYELTMPIIGGDRAYSSGVRIFPGNGYYNDVAIYSGATLIVDGAISPRMGFDDFVVAGGGTVRIRGDVRMVIKDDLIVHGGSIELEDGATLTLFIGDDFDIDYGAVGVPHQTDTPVRSLDDLKEYHEPGRVRIYQFDKYDGGKDSSTWQFDNGSLVMGAIHARNGSILMQNGTTLVGRVTAKWFRLEDSRLFYDPALDNRMGFTDAKSPIWDGGDVRAEYKPILDFLNSLAVDKVSELSDTQRIMLRMYVNAENKPAFLRELASYLSGENVTEAGDPVLNILEVTAEKLDALGYNAEEIGDALNATLTSIEPTYAVDLGLIRVDGQSLDAILGSLLGGKDGGAVATGQVTDILAENSDSVPDIAKPDADGNYTFRREAKARARTLDRTALQIEDR